MKRKILTIITIGSIFCMALTGCGDSSRNQATSNRASTSDRTTKSDATTTDVAERSDGSEAERENKEEAGAKIENQAVREAGLYQSDGSFIPWDDLGIDVETDYSRDNNITEANNPYKVFTDNNYAGELVLPNNITSIGVYAFDSCRSLTGIELPDNITSIGEYTFACTSLESIELPDNITSIGEYAFYACYSLTNINLSNTQITSIGRGAFQTCASLTSIDLPDTLTSIREDAFCDCDSLTNINYAGTMEKWNAIDKGLEWNGYSGLETITCSDGVITL